ncbi:MAG: hypothetical protein IT439_04950 [Phycisphaerales bacterium]|nr:hypothetical protein [Phycisphaerales bacterium]
MHPRPVSRPPGNRLSVPPADRTLILLEEYRQVYALAIARLNALDQRLPITLGVLTAMLGSIGALPEEVRVVLLTALPLTLVWVVRTTINHARSLEDALRRIEEIERLVAIRTGEKLLAFQSSHPSRGRSVGGRTGIETIEAALAASAILQGGCLYLSQAMTTGPDPWQSLFPGFVVALAASQLWMRWRIRKYRYEPR